MVFLWSSGVAHGRPSTINRGFDIETGFGIASIKPNGAMAFAVWRAAVDAVDLFASASARYFGWSVVQWRERIGQVIRRVDEADESARAAVRAELAARESRRTSAQAAPDGSAS